MNRHEKLRLATDRLASTGGQTVTIAGVNYEAVVSSAPLDPDYEMAGTILTEACTAVITKTNLLTSPAVDSSAGYLGKTWRIGKIEDRPSARVLTLVRP